MKKGILILVVFVGFFASQRSFATDTTSLYVTEPVPNFDCQCVVRDEITGKMREVSNTTCNDSMTRLYKCDIPQENTYTTQEVIRTIVLTRSYTYLLNGFGHPFITPFISLGAGYTFRLIAPWIYF